MSVRDWIDEIAPGAIVWNDCDSAIVGVADRCGDEPLVVYDYDKLVESFVSEGMSPEEAGEWVEFNIVGAFVGPRTPLILRRYDAD